MTDPTPAPEAEADPVTVAEAEATEISTAERPLGALGAKFNRRSPFVVGMGAAAGVAVIYGAVQALVDARSALILIGVALFLAVGLEPVVSWLVRHRFPRWAAVTTVFLSALILVAALLAIAIPPLAQQASQLVAQAPDYLREAQDHSSTLGRLNDRFHLQQQLTDAVNGSTVLEHLVSAVTLVFDAVTKLVLVAVLTVFFLADMPQIRTNLYRLVPGARRPRAILIGDQIFAKVGAYVLGNVVISVIAAVGTFLWLEAFGVPYPLLLAIFVAVFDLVPVVGSTVAGVVVAAVALTVSIPVSVATVAFFVAYRLIEDYLLMPRIIGRAVQVPAVVTVVAVLVGGAVLGIIGALVAIPIAAALQLLVQDLLYPRLDEL